MTEQFQEWLASWQVRQGRLPNPLDSRDAVVLAGAGKVGHEFLDALRASAVPVVAFADNNPAKWGQTVAGLPVLSAAEAVSRFGRDATFIITIGRVGSGVDEIRAQFSSLGARTVMHFTEAIRIVPRIWPQFFLAPDRFEAADLERCLAAYRLFRDDQSKALFLSHLRWRATLDPVALPRPDYDDQYFPPGIIAPRHCAAFVDVGAFTGDTLTDLSRFAGDALRAYYGFEPDAKSYETLVARASDVSRSSNVHVVTKRVAIGATRQMVSFAGLGAATSQVNSEGSEQVECAPLDSMGVVAPTYVKIDVEGAEAEVLAGAAGTLGRWKPTVAIASYHRPKDLFDLPLWLAAVAPDYRFYLRSHGDAGIDLVCYAVREPAAV